MTKATGLLADIQSAIADFERGLSEAGYNAVHALINATVTETSASFKAQYHPVESKHWYDDGTIFQSVDISRLENAPAAIRAAITEITPISDVKRDHFMRKLGEVIDLGREAEVDVEFINPLVETAKRLSENAITHAAE